MHVATLVAIGMSFGLSAAALAAAPSSPASSAELMAPITGLIGDAACESQAECRVVGVGAKPCGGPTGYLAWSDRGTDANALRAAVEAQAEAQKAEDRAAGLLSNCRVVPAPSTVCRPRAADGRKTCQLVPGSAL